MKTHEILDLTESDHSILDDGKVEFELDLYDQATDEHQLITLEARIRPGYFDFGAKSHQSDEEGEFESDLIVNQPFTFKGNEYPAGNELSEELLPYVMMTALGSPGSAGIRNLGELYDLLLADVEESGKLDDFIRDFGEREKEDRGDWEYDRRKYAQTDGGGERHVT